MGINFARFNEYVNVLSSKKGYSSRDAGLCADRARQLKEMSDTAKFETTRLIIKIATVGMGIRVYFETNKEDIMEMGSYIPDPDRLSNMAMANATELWKDVKHAVTIDQRMSESEYDYDEDTQDEWVKGMMKQLIASCDLLSHSLKLAQDPAGAENVSFYRKEVMEDFRSMKFMDRFEKYARRVKDGRRIRTPLVDLQGSEGGYNARGGHKGEFRRYGSNGDDYERSRKDLS